MELKGGFVGETQAMGLGFLIYRVELKVGVLGYLAYRYKAELFLIYRVELKGMSYLNTICHRPILFLIYRVELKVWKA